MEELAKLLATILPNTPWTARTTAIQDGNMDTVELPPALNADYFFQFHLYPNGEKGISAQLLSGDSETFFWFKTFELPDYKNDAHVLDEDFLAVVKTLLTRETMISQKRGTFWHTFRLSYRVGDQARVLSSESGLRFGFRAPSIKSRTHTYRSESLGENHSMDPEPDIRHGTGSISWFAASSSES